MASGTISLGTSGKMEGRIVWSSTSNGAVANSSNVTASIQVKKNESTQATIGTWTGKLNIGGTTKNFSVHKEVLTSWVELLSFSITKTHSSNGAGTCSISGSITGPLYTTLQDATVTASKTVTLDTIPRQATITQAFNFNDEANPTITYSNPAGNNVTSLQACISLTGATDDIAYRNISKTGTSYTFNLTDAERKYLRQKATSDELSVRFYVKTVIGGETYLKYVTKTMSIINAAPTLNPVVSDNDSVIVAVTGNNQKYIKYFSNPSYIMNAAAKKEATIKSVSAVCGSVTRTTQSGEFYNIESNTITFTVTDSRNNITKKTVTLDMVNYIRLTCNFGGGKPNAEGKFTYLVKGNYFNGNLGNNANSLTVFYRYKPQSGSYSEWMQMSATISGNTYTASIDITGLDYQETYTFQAYAKDKIETVYSDEKSIKASPVFDWGENDFSFHVPVVLDNAKQLYFKNTDNTDVMMVSLNNLNQSFFGYGGYNQNLGSTYFDGNSVYIRSRNNISNTAEGTIGGNKAWTNSSDSRLKNNIEDLPEVFCNIWLELSPKIFNWNELNNGDNTKHFGLIAQDVIAAFEKYNLDYKDYGFVSIIPIDEVDYFALTYEYYHMITAQVLKKTITELNAVKEDISLIKKLLAA